MKIITWNVNSIRTRLDHLIRVLQEQQPDFMLLQELKCETEQFPYAEMEALGYRSYVSGEKSYNGVAIITKTRGENIRTHLWADDSQARYLEGFFGSHYIISVYVPNGNGGEDRYQYKLRFMEHLHQRLSSLLQLDVPIIIGGDFNIVHTPSDIYENQEQICFTPPERQHLHALYNLGMIDAFRRTHPEDPLQPGPYTWWDYRGRGWSLNQGMRLDYLFISPHLLSHHKETQILSDVRSWPKASDHAPVVMTC